MADTLISPEWTFTSATTAQPVNGGAFHYMLQEAVMQRVGSNEQWRIGFIGTFLTDSGLPATPRQCGSMAIIADHYYGRYRWSEEDQAYISLDGVRVAWQDPSGGLWASDQSIAGPNSVFEVTASEVTGAITGTVRQVRIRFSCALRGPNMTTISATGEYVGPLVVL
jgi:acetyl-CoA acetyltransferase